MRAHRGFAALAWLQVALCKPPATLTTLRYSVDLAAPANQRWKASLEDFLDTRGTKIFEETYTGWLLGLSLLMPEHFLPGRPLRSSSARLLEAFRRGHPELVEELLVMSDALRRRAPHVLAFEPELLVSAAAIYVLGNISPRNTTDVQPHIMTPSACTSTVVMGRDGHVLHGRSLDYEPRTAMAASVAEVDFLYNGSYAYTCLHPMVYPTGLQWFTCQRPGAHSLSVNARSQGVWNEHNTTFEEFLRRLEAPGRLLLGEMGAAAMAARGYSEALELLASAPVVSSNYFILAGAGAGEGAVVTRFGNRSSADVWALGSGAADGQPSWMRVQTNVDHWVTYESGAYATHRRQHLVDLLRAQGAIAGSVTKDELWAMYITDQAIDAASLKRMHPEDTGAILRPTTIATLVMSPALAPRSGGLSASVWATDPQIHGPGLAQQISPPAGRTATHGQPVLV